MVTVANTGDNGAGSLRQIIADANSGDYIDLSQVEGAITLSSGELSSGKDLTICGPTNSRLTISGANASRIFNIASETATSVTITDNDLLLTISKQGKATGTVTSSLTGILCGNDCSETYPENTQITLTATADAGATFSGWSGSRHSGFTRPECQ